MVVIGITGGSGCGKSTISEIISSKFEKCKIVHFDKIHTQVDERHKDEIIKALGIDEKNEYWVKCIHKSLDNMKKSIIITKDDLTYEIQKIINESKDDYDILIIDWFLFPLIEFYDNCDITITIKAKMENKYDRLKKRLIEAGEWEFWKNEEDFNNRLTLSCLDGIDYHSDYVISNDGTTEELEDAADLIIKKLRP